MHFLHLLEPHTPYLDLPDGRRYGADPTLRMISPREDGEPGGDRRAAAEPPALLDRQRLQLEVAHVDRLLGDVLDRLHRTGLYDDALIVVTSDHGIAFQPGGPVRGLGIEPIDEAAATRAALGPAVRQGAGTGRRRGERPPGCRPSTCCPPWPTGSASTCRGRSTARPSPRRPHLTRSGTSSTWRDRPSPPSTSTHRLPSPPTSTTCWPSAWIRCCRAGGRTAGGRPVPEPRLVGRPAVGPRLAAQIDGLGPFLDVDLTDPVVPAVVAGRVDGDVGRVAVAVNGTIAAVVDTYDDGDGPGCFAAIVDPALLVDGFNGLTIHHVA